MLDILLGAKVSVVNKADKALAVTVLFSGRKHRQSNKCLTYIKTCRSVNLWQGQQNEIEQDKEMHDMDESFYMVWQGDWSLFFFHLKNYFNFKVIIDSLEVAWLYKDIPVCILPVFLRVSSYMTIYILKLGNWHGYSLQILFKLHQFLHVLTCVYMRVWFCAFLLHV